MECMCTLYTVYISVQYICIYLSNAVNMYEIHIIVFGAVHSDRTVVVPLHKHFSYCLCNFLIPLALSWISTVV
jgi:hypothetical protein